MKLDELFNQNSNSLANVVSLVGKRLGNLFQMGGAGRVYKVKNNTIGSIFMIGSSTSAIGFAWQSTKMGVSEIYFWHNFNINASPDYELSIPLGARIDSVMIDTIVSWLKSPTEGKVVVRTGVMEAEPAPDPRALSAAVGGAPVDAAPTKQDELNPLVTLGQAKVAANTGEQGRLVLLAKRADGTYFVVPGFNQYLKKVESFIMNAFGLKSTKGMNAMDQEFALLKERADLIVNNKVSNRKSLIVTGDPGNGKSYGIEQVIAESGLVQGKDYVYIKGGITTASAYEVLLAQTNGLIIFDDCDSLMTGTESVNMMKTALDSRDVREVSRINKNSIDTLNMTVEERDKICQPMSRILRGVATNDDIRMFENKIKLPKSKPNEMDIFNTKPDSQKLDLIREYIKNHMPSVINFRGRVIFISNIPQERWDTAILSRSFTTNISFTSEQMYEYIWNIRDKLPGKINKQQREETLEYVWAMYHAGNLKWPITFRYVLEAFDYRTAPSWRKLIIDWKPPRT